MYIRAPFICEGAVGGVMGALLAVIFLAFSRTWLLPKLYVKIPFAHLSGVSMNGAGILSAQTSGRRRPSALSPRGYRSDATHADVTRDLLDEVLSFKALYEALVRVADCSVVELDDNMVPLRIPPPKR